MIDIGSSSGELHIWTCMIQSSIPAEHLRSKVTSQEWSRGSQMADPRRTQFIAMRAITRQVLARYTGNRDPREVEIVGGVGERPVIDGPHLRISISHSSGLLAIAVSGTCEVGIDIQRVEPFPSWRAIARRLFGPEATAELSQLPESARSFEFTRHWTRTEAALKASGQGLTRANASCVQRELARYSLFEFEPRHGWAGAAASLYTPARVFTRRITSSHVLLAS